MDAFLSLSEDIGGFDLIDYVFKSFLFFLHNIGYYHLYRFIVSVWETGIRLNRFGLDTDLECDNVTFKVHISILKVTAP